MLAALSHLQSGDSHFYFSLLSLAHDRQDEPLSLLYLVAWNVSQGFMLILPSNDKGEGGHQRPFIVEETKG